MVIQLYSTISMAMFNSYADGKITILNGYIKSMAIFHSYVNVY